LLWINDSKSIKKFLHLFNKSYYTMNISAEKNEIIKWINSLENPDTIEEINKIRLRKSFDFEKEWKKGISGEELKKRTKEYIKSLPWKK
jgi:hypothetical protein